MDNYAVSITSAAIGAAVAVFTNFWRTRYTVRAQDFSKRIEEIAASIRQLEVLACEYWCDPTEGKPSDRPYILGTQEKISIMLKYLHDQYKKFDAATISEPLSDFFEACTGGSFDKQASPAEPDRVRQILISGERLKIELMKTRGTLY